MIDCNEDGQIIVIEALISQLKAGKQLQTVQF